jgi:hypothetical protein
VRARSEQTLGLLRWLLLEAYRGIRVRCAGEPRKWIAQAAAHFEQIERWCDGLHEISISCERGSNSGQRRTSELDCA